MRIALVAEHARPLAATTSGAVGGQSIHVASLARALVHRGNDVTVFTGRTEAERPPRLLTSSGYVLESPPEQARSRPSFAGYLERRLANDHHDVVHAHFWTSGVAAMRCRAALGIPVVQTFHGLGVVARRHLHGVDPGPPQRIGVEARLCASADQVIAMSSAEAFELRRLGLDAARTSIVPSGVDIATFVASPPAYRPVGPRRVLVVSGLAPGNGIDDAIRAVRDLRDVELVVAGGPESAVDLVRDPEARRLSSVASVCGVRHRVRFLGAVDRRGVARLMATADAVVATPWYEPFGMVALEAMASGVPVVATAVGGMIDSVVDGVTGVLVPPRDPDAVAAALRRVLGDPSFSSRLGRAGAERARRTYSWDCVARGALGAYARARGDERADRDVDEE